MSARGSRYLAEPAQPFRICCLSDGHRLRARESCFLAGLWCVGQVGAAEPAHAPLPIGSRSMPLQKFSRMVEDNPRSQPKRLLNRVRGSVARPQRRYAAPAPSGARPRGSSSRLVIIRRGGKTVLPQNRWQVSLPSDSLSHFGPAPHWHFAPLSCPSRISSCLRWGVYVWHL